MPKIRISSRLRDMVAERAFYCCEYCWSQADFSTESFSVEHIIPLSRGGENTHDNGAFACGGCNGHKYAKTEAMDPLENVAVPLFNPRKQIWGEHFQWNSDYTLILGVTPTGRATVAALKMNRSSLINLRKALYAYGEHPPAIFNYKRM